ncbi:2Fe-2S iron-sulfur cluster binding domain-containing protein [Ensifer sp. ENS07]|uniref:2Fe-2S iron-sulfur cluster-binding protein n=1 Tax=Ensifer sp. ENS07 TaxID=2769274 RepID=UPI00178563E9|nr:2Fe-2S iron-sulfur cluster-binding protein [Ensifer sp. ENS07]MBD9641783.1 2Fe-2S iron-sulfur cluster binding domain-containing protein [Ensifer sp. ENS07]
MSHKLRIEQFDREILVETNETVLEAALRSGIDFPFDCRSGVCGECKCALVSGQVEMQPYLDVALDDEERNQSFILGCRAMLRSDCVLALLDSDEPAPTNRFKTLSATVTKIERVTHDIAIISCAADNGDWIDFLPGQYASLQFEGMPERAYSFANAPSSQLMEFHIRAVPDGAVSPAVYANLKSGDRLKIAGPKGMAYLRKKHSGPMVFAAGGTGLAPILSMLRALKENKTARAGHIYFGVRTPKDIYLEDELKALALSLEWDGPQVVVSSEPAETGRRAGFLADAMKDDLSGCKEMKAYLCGPPIMIETCRKVLTNLGLEHSNCHVDTFWSR